jgi:hypothetical protein
MIEDEKRSAEGQTMQAAHILDLYLRSLLETREVWKRYTDNRAWTAEATRALVNVGLTAFPAGVAAARGHRDSYGRSEYLTLDVCIVDPAKWSAPMFIAEHENASVRAKIQYCAWKLLATRAQQRVLVAYYAAGSNVPNQAAIVGGVKKVCKDIPGDIVIITADANARPSSADKLRRLHAVSTVGVRT